MVTQSRRSLVDDLAAFDRLLEVGIGNRPDVAAALVDRGRTVAAIDVADAADVPVTAEAATSVGGGSPGGEARSPDDGDGSPTGEAGASSIDVRRADVSALAAADDPLAALGRASPLVEGDASDRIPATRRATPDGIDAVYARNLPAELQRPTVALAERLDAACRFTTLGFEEPVVPVARRSLPGTTLFVARDRDGSPVKRP